MAKEVYPRCMTCGNRLNFIETGKYTRLMKWDEDGEFSDYDDLECENETLECSECGSMDIEWVEREEPSTDEKPKCPDCGAEMHLEEELTKEIQKDAPDSEVWECCPCGIKAPEREYYQHYIYNVKKKDLEWMASG